MNPLFTPFLAERLYVLGLDWYSLFYIAGWSSWLARKAHNLEVAGSSPAPATKTKRYGFDDI
jgi:hypothetical protein